MYWRELSYQYLCTIISLFIAVSISKSDMICCRGRKLRGLTSLVEEIELVFDDFCSCIPFSSVSFPSLILVHTLVINHIHYFSVSIICNSFPALPACAGGKHSTTHQLCPSALSSCRSLLSLKYLLVVLLSLTCLSSCISLSLGYYGFIWTGGEWRLLLSGFIRAPPHPPHPVSSPLAYSVQYSLMCSVYAFRLVCTMWMQVCVCAMANKTGSCLLYVYKGDEHHSEHFQPAPLHPPLPIFHSRVWLYDSLCARSSPGFHDHVPANAAISLHISSLVLLLSIPLSCL